jgi:hypothetical protein
LRLADFAKPDRRAGSNKLHVTDARECATDPSPPGTGR